MRYLLATLLLACISVPTLAKPHLKRSDAHAVHRRHALHHGHHNSRHLVRHRARHHTIRVRRDRVSLDRLDREGSQASSLSGLAQTAPTSDGLSQGIVAHPEGCPRIAFCGCGVARYVFGQINGGMRNLWLAANWFRYPRAEPGPGMVAVRQHHVFAIVRVLGGGRVLAYDPNGGRHKTWMHVRSLVGYSVRNPRG